MSAIQCWPQALGQPVTFSLRGWSNSGTRSSSSSTSQRAKAFCFRDGEFAEFRACASDGTAPERRGFDAQSRGVEFLNEGIDVFAGHIDDDEILHVGGAEFARGIFVGEICGSEHLSGGDASAEDCGAYVVEAGLFLRVNADVVAIGVRRREVFDRRDRVEAETSVEFAEETFGGPAMLSEEMFQSSAIAIFAENGSGREKVRQWRGRRAGPGRGG